MQEDLGPDNADITSAAILPDQQGRGVIEANESGILAGADVIASVFRQVDPSLDMSQLCEEGAEFKRGHEIARISGALGSILTAERTALNFLAHLSGISTLTSEFVAAVGSTGARIFDTRKTMPGLRRLEKLAVRLGGGNNHRFGLFDGLLIKDNHLVGRSIADAIGAARAVFSDQRVEVEVETLEQAQAAVDAGADIIMLDNMDLAMIKRAVSIVKGKAEIEVSGGISLGNVRAVAEAGAERISVGSITQGAQPIDFSLTIVNDEGGR